MDPDTAEAAWTAVVRAGGAIEIGRLRAHFGDAAARSVLRRPGVIRSGGLAIVNGTEQVPRLIASQRSAVVTCITAAAEHGIPIVGRAIPVVHLAVPRSRSHLRGGPRTDGIVVHRECQPVTTDRERPWLADIATSVNRLLACCDVVQATVALDHVLNRGLMSPGRVRLPATGPHAPRIRRALDRANSRSRSILETMARLELEDAGLPVEAGVLIDTVGEVDLLVAGLIVIDLDGQQHATVEQMNIDRERDLRLVRLGYVVIRVTWKQMRAGLLVPTVTDALGRFAALTPPVRPPFSGRRVHSWDQEERLDAVGAWW